MNARMNRVHDAIGVASLVNMSERDRARARVLAWLLGIALNRLIVRATTQRVRHDKEIARLNDTCDNTSLGARRGYQNAEIIFKSAGVRLRARVIGAD